VPCTLKELYNGCIKTVNYQRQTIALDGKTLQQTVSNKQVEVKAGMDPIHSFTFAGEGHQQPGRKHSNLFVKLVMMPPHP